MGYHIANRRIQNTRFAELVPSPGYDWLPVGMIAPYMGATSPDRWLICDGSEYDPADLPELYAVNSAFHATDAPGEFRVPDLRGRSPIGAASGFGSPQAPVRDVALGDRPGDWRVPYHRHFLPTTNTGGGYPAILYHDSTADINHIGGGLTGNPRPDSMDTNGTGANTHPSTGVNFIVYAGRPTVGISPLSELAPVTTRMMIEARMAAKGIGEEEIKMLKEQLEELKRTEAA